MSGKIGNGRTNCPRANTAPQGKVCQWVLCALSLWATTALPRARAAEPLTREQLLVVPNASALYATYSDYDHDGFDDFVQPGENRIDLVQSRSGSILRTYVGRPETKPTFGSSFESIPDTDGDGLNEFLVGAYLEDVGENTRAGVVYGIAGSTPGGSVTSVPLLFRHEWPGFGKGGYGKQFAQGGNIAAISWADESRVDFIDATTGEFRARLFSPTFPSLFGMAVSSIGDLNGDGNADFAIADPVVTQVTPFPYGSVYIVSGAITASGWTSIDALPEGALLARITPTADNRAGAVGDDGDREALVNLGDPTPFDGLDEQLIVAGSPESSSAHGGFSAYILTRTGSGRFRSRDVMNYIASGSFRFARDIASLGDVSGDGVADLAIMDPHFTDSPVRESGRILVVSGAGLMNGFDSTDILQEIRGDIQSPLRGDMRFIGDYDHDGRGDFAVTREIRANNTSAAEIYAINLKTSSTRSISATKFEEPAINSPNYMPSATGSELGFTTTATPIGGSSPIAAVTNSGDATRSKVLTHRSISAMTKLDFVPLANWSDVFASVLLRVADTNYENGDFVEVVITNGVESLEVFRGEGTDAENDALELLVGRGFVAFSIDVPDTWESASFEIRSASNSGGAAERYDFDDVRFVGVLAVPEPSTPILAAVALAVIAGVTSRRMQSRAIIRRFT